MLLLVLFLAAWVGHCYTLLLVLNWLYGNPFDRTFLKLARLVCGWLLLAPPIVGGVLGFDLWIAPPSASAWLLLYGYGWFCVAMGTLAFPVATLVGLCRRPPAMVQEETTRIVDVAKELGQRPIGNGKHRWIAAQSWNDLFTVEFTTLTATFDDLPSAWDGLTILHLSDLHFYGTLDRTYYEHVFRQCMNDGVPDLVVLSGDIIDAERYLEWIKPVLGELRWNVAAFAILGNHDWWQDAVGVRERLAQLGMNVVGNRWESLLVRGEPLNVIGHEGPWFRPPPDVANLPEGFRLLISHTPDNIAWARQHGIRLMLSGHNHGGQVRLPIIGSMFVPSKYSRRYDMGTFYRAPTLLHVNRGLGGKEPIRVRCRPQVTRLILRRNASP